MEDIQQARALFIKYHGSFYNMFYGGSPELLGTYKAYHVPKELEIQWLKEEQENLLLQEQNSDYFLLKSIDLITLFVSYPVNIQGIKSYLTEVEKKMNSKIEDTERFQLLNNLLNLSCKGNICYKEQDLFVLYENLLEHAHLESSFYNNNILDLSQKNHERFLYYEKSWKDSLSTERESKFSWQWHFMKDVKLFEKHGGREKMLQWVEEREIIVLNQMKNANFFLVSGVGLIDLFLIHPNLALIDEYFQILERQKTFDHDVVVHLLENLKKLEKIRLRKKQRKMLDGIYKYLYALSVDGNVKG